MLFRKIVGRYQQQALNSSIQNCQAENSKEQLAGGSRETAKSMEVVVPVSTEQVKVLYLEEVYLTY